MAEFYKLTCINSSKECNIIEPISEKLKFIGAVNPITGALFNKEDIESAIKANNIDLNPIKKDLNKLDAKIDSILIF